MIMSWSMLFITTQVVRDLGIILYHDWNPYHQRWISGEESMQIIFGWIYSSI